MKSNAGCWRRRLVGLVIAMSLLNGCGTGGSDGGSVVCPPVVEYSPAIQERAAQEVQLLPMDSSVVGMLKDYAVMREQARHCR